MREFPTILDLIGHTPIVRLPKLQPAGAARVLAKLEYVNPGGSIKDRIGLPMIEAAERDGLLRPGGTIVEPTSGNTGIGLAMVAAQRGYRCIFVMPDKMSREKIALLRAFGAEIVVCPTEVEPEDPRSYYSVSHRMAEETPGAFNPNQYANPANPQAHYDSTGPEIWEQLGDELDVLVVGVGTGGTVTGISRYLKERKPDLQIVGADPIGSIYSSDAGALVPRRGRGRGLLADDVRPRLGRPLDRASPIATRSPPTRRMARAEGILIGAVGRHGAARRAERRRTSCRPSKTVLVILPDGGRPVSLEGLQRRLDARARHVRGRAPAHRGRARGRAQRRRAGARRASRPSQPAGDAIALLQRFAVSQLPVIARRRGRRLRARAPAARPRDAGRPRRARGARRPT